MTTEVVRSDAEPRFFSVSAMRGVTFCEYRVPVALETCLLSILDS